MNWYFAYGSNMNPARMQARGLAVLEALPGRLPGYGLCFNKRDGPGSGPGLRQYPVCA